MEKNMKKNIYQSIYNESLLLFNRNKPNTENQLYQQKSTNKKE